MDILSMAPDRLDVLRACATARVRRLDAQAAKAKAKAKK